MRIFKFTLLAGIAPALLCAGALTLPIGTSSSTITFTPGPNTIALGTPCTNGCSIGGSGTIGSTTVNWNLDTEFSGSPIFPTYSGSNPFTINQGNAVVTFILTDTSSDDITGSIRLNTLTSSTSVQTVQHATISGDTTDLNATITFTGVTVVSKDLVTAVDNVFGSIPVINSTANFDLVMTCGISTPCVVVGTAQDPGTIGNLVGSISPSGVPEPGSMALLASGLTALMIGFRRRN